jgi:hypothetical protein
MDRSVFAIQLREEVLATREIEGSEEFAESAFVTRVLGLLSEAGEIDDAEIVRYKAHGARLNGYVLDVETESLDLFVALYTGDVSAPTIDKSQVETAYRQVITFFQKATGDLYTRLEESGPAFDAAYSIYRAFEGEVAISKVRLFLLTDGVVRSRRPDAVLSQRRRTGGKLAGVEFSYHTWDLERLYRWYTSGHAREEIDIDIASLSGSPLPCLRMPDNTIADCETFLAFVPGQLLVSIYSQYGARLLERNVRSFLQARGTVNREIRKTILEEPQRFLAYNNGLTATASTITTTPVEGGGIGITRIRDFQIVNGGQTTASLFHAVRKDDADVAAVSVQLKLNRVREASQLEDVVARISRFANSQNKVNVADFSANDPFHRRLEELSRTVWAPASAGSQRQTHWFYERARGQYADERARAGTPAKVREFELLHPRQQMFTKTDLAKYENTWLQRPHLVSRGAQKNFAAFAIELGKKSTSAPDEQYYHRMVAKALLFKQAESLVRAGEFGGYRANIVTYTLAVICHATAQRVDLDAIWKAQNVSAPLQALIRTVSIDVHGVLVSPPGGGNVTEWCKSEGCWEAVKRIAMKVPRGVSLIDVPLGSSRVDGEGTATTDVSEQTLIAEAAAIPAETWFGLAKWAADTRSLAPWQRSLAFSIGRRISRDQAPTIKQARHGLSTLRSAEELGFRVAHETLRSA